MTPWLLSLALTAHAQDRSFGTIDRAAWIFTAPDEQAPRYRHQAVEEAPEHALSPVVVVEIQGPAVNGYVPIQLATHAAPRKADGALHPPDRAPPDWPHCYVQPPIMAQMALRGFVREQDLLPVLKEDVTLTRDDGTVLQLAKGLSLVGSRRQFRVRGMHVELLLRDLPRRLVGSTYTRATPPARRDLVAEDGPRTWRIQPTWRPVFDAREDTLTTLRNPAQDGESASGIQDRCLRLVVPEPLSPIPRFDETALRDSPIWPISTPPDTPIRAGSGQPLGQTEHDLILWTRSNCRWEESRGLCCQPFPGLAVQRITQGLCLVADLPTRERDRSLRQVMDNRSDRLRRVFGALSQSQPRAEILSLTTDGTLTEAQARGVLEPELSVFADCYARRLPFDPDLTGELHLRIPVGPDAHARTPRVMRDTLRQPTIIDCIGQRLRIPAFVDNLGAPATQIDLHLRFSTAPRASDPEPSEQP